MASAPAFQFYAQDFLCGTADMTPEEVGGYIRLLAYQWIKGSLPDDDTKLKLLSGCSSAALKVIRIKFELCEDCQLRNERLETVRSVRNQYRENSSRGGKKSAESRAKLKVISNARCSPVTGEASKSPSGSQVNTNRTSSDGPCKPQVNVSQVSSDDPSETQVNVNQKSSHSPSEPQATVNLSVFSLQSSSSVKAEEASASFASSRPPPATPQPIDWTASRGWIGITDALQSKWSEAYPACNIPRQLASMSAWLTANPTKAKKGNWMRFIVNWLVKEQQRGGDTPTIRPFQNQQNPARVIAPPGKYAGLEIIVADG